MTRYSVKKPFTVLVGVLLVIVLGVVSFFDLNTDLLPTLDLPYVVVYTIYPGASPERVELAVTKTVEQAVATTSGLENMESISAENVSIVILEFNGDTNMDSAMIELSGNIDMVSGYFDDMVQSPMILKLDPDMLPIQMLAVDVDDMDIKELSRYINDELAPRLERVNGVATVDVSGTVEDHVDIALNQEKIDVINDQILKSVSGTLYSTKKDLDKAQQELTDGKARLEDAEQQAFDKLADVSSQIDAGQAQAQAIAGELASLKAKQEIFEGAKTAIEGITELESAIGILQSTVGSLPPEMKSMTLSEALRNPLFQSYASQLQPLIDQGLLSGSDTVEQLADKLQNSVLPALEDQLRQMGIPEEIITGRDTARLDGMIGDLTDEITQTQFMADQMAETLQKLQDTYAQLEKAKMEATAQMAAATVELETAQAQLDRGVAEFEAARDEALKQANIDSLVTREMLTNILTAENFSMPAGYIDSENDTFTIKVGDTFQNLTEIENLLLVDMGLDGVDPIHLKDVADISIADNSADSYVRINGNPGITLAMQKQSTASTSRVCKDVNDELREIMRENSAVHITQLMDQGIYIEMVVDSVMENLLYGGLIALVVLFIFLKDLKPTIIIGFSIPISLLFAIVLMYFSGVTLNIVSLSGLALGVGMLVDNSVVVIENTYRLRNMGVSRIKAAVQGATQVAGAIAASTLTTICVFVPILFTDGLSRQIFTDMGLTISYSLVASLIVALTVVPAMSSALLKDTTEKKHPFFDKLLRAYEKALSWNLDHKSVVIVLTSVLLAISIWFAFNMPMAFLPDMDTTQMQMNLTLTDEGATEEELISKSEIIARRTAEIEDVETVGMTMGGSGLSSVLGGGDDELSMSFYVVLKDDKDLTNQEVADLIEEANTDMGEDFTVSASSVDLSALGGSGISIIVKGNEIDGLRQEAANIADILSTVEGVAAVDDGTEDEVAEIRVDVDKEEAMKHGLTVAQVYRLVSTAVTDTTTATTVTFDGTDMDAVIHSRSPYTLENISDLVVTTEADDDGNDVDITLGEIANIHRSRTPTSIGRDNQSRYRTVSATLEDGYNVSLVSRDVEDALRDYTPSPGYSFEMRGENETIMDAMKDMFKMIAMAIIFIYLIMVAQFQSLRSPFIVIFTIPLAFTGGLLALKLTGQMLTITSMIGFLILAGVVVNNGIVFVDYVNNLRLEGIDKRRALLQTGRDRIRPILMTALTTILAMSTMALGVGMGAEMSQGMAIVTIGGLSYATLLTLFLVPALYDIFSKKEMTRIDVNFDDEN